MGYAVGDRIEFKSYNDRKSLVYLLAIVPTESYESGVMWEVKRQRHGHLGLISERDIIRKISSGFEGYGGGIEVEISQGI